jgi:hypothetical protein
MAKHSFPADRRPPAVEFCTVLSKARVAGLRSYLFGLASRPLNRTSSSVSLSDDTACGVVGNSP